MNRVGALLLVLLAHAVALPAAADESAGPPAPGAPRYVVPLARLLIVDAASYAGAALIWPEGYAPKQGSKQTFAESWTTAPDYRRADNPFETDGDPWWINGVLHPLYGSEMYLAARGWGHGPLVSGLFTLFASTSWEYLIEAWFKQPSAIDLFWTPLAGALLGELRRQAWLAARDEIAAAGARRLVMIVLDPLGELERAILGCDG